ncbi:MAG TPA: FtsW/RodA/SpoVE family cell cycle protein [Candidatus Pacearchaeota archaeon]|nr:FtsW/RodA/SpoVE family cell cycle protein [Candidatus Pacearchaeota archaeon]HPO75511.1 FtsW/RodA/SpoVE family cell cycle protein [Candidatus Pacearchaeota archaeon]
MKKFDWAFLSFAVLLSVLGLIVIYSLGLPSGNFSNFQKQLIFLIIGIFFAIGLSFVDIKALRESSLFVLTLYFLSLVFLVGVFFLGKNIRGSKSWYVLGPFTLEPVEFVKIIFIIFFAKYFSQRHVEMYQKRHIVLSFIYAFLPTALVFLQPDFGSAIILLLIWLLMMLVSGIKRKHLLIIIGVAIICFIVAWNFVFTAEQKDRFTTFLEPYINPQGKYLDPQGTGYHIQQSIIAIGSGGLLGKGFFESYTQAKLGFLPEAHTDFIFSTFAEMFGIVGILILFLLFALFFWRGSVMAVEANNNFSRLLISGFLILVGVETFINIGMNIGLLPISGLPLPFLSYGGSSLISLFIGIGLIESIRVHGKK